jgi:hypothetical protein
LTRSHPSLNTIAWSFQSFAKLLFSVDLSFDFLRSLFSLKVLFTGLMEVTWLEILVGLAVAR